MIAADLIDSHDDSLRALGRIMEAWEAGSTDGIGREYLAYAAIFAALSELVSTYGEDAVAKLTAGLGARVQSGEFTLTPRGRVTHQ